MSVEFDPDIKNKSIKNKGKKTGEPKSKRGRPKGSKNSEVIRTLQGSSSSQSNGNLRRSSRYHSVASFAEEENSDNEKVGHIDNKNNDDPKIEDIVCCNYSSEKNIYLCKIPNKSYLDLQPFEKSTLEAGNSSKILLDHYQKLIHKGFEVISSIGNDYSTPSIRQIDSDYFIIDRIIAHKSHEDFSDIVPQIIDPSHYLPGLPIVGTLDFSFILPHQNVFQEPSSLCGKYLGEDGSIYINNEPYYNLNEIVENSNLIRRATTNGPPIGTEFLIKWRGLGESKATWETDTTIYSSTVCPINRLEFDNILSIYWSKCSSNLDINNHQIDIIPDQYAELERGMQLSDYQREAQESIFKTMLTSNKCYLVGITGSGRVATIVSFLWTMKKCYHNSQPALIICETNDIPVFEMTIRLMTKLYWSTFSSNKNDCNIVKQYEINTEYGTKFDVLIADSSTIFTELPTLRQINWRIVVVDFRHREYDIDLDAFSLPAFRVFLYNDNHYQYPYTKMDNYCFQYNETILLDSDLSSQLIRIYLSDTLKGRPTKHIVECVSSEALRVILVSYSHPFLALQINAIMKSIFRSRMEIGANNQFTTTHHVKMLSMFSSKLHQVLSLVSKPCVSIIIANDLPVLRIIHQFLESNSISSVFLTSNLPQESPSFSRSISVFLLTRNLTSPSIIDLHPNQLIFYDLPNSILIDHCIVQFFNRFQSPEVYRLLIYDSLETVLYSQLLKKPGLKISDLSKHDCEMLLRCVSLMTKIGRNKPQYPSIIGFQVPNECQQTGELIDEVFNQLLNDNSFWEEVYPSSTGQRIQQSKWGAGEVIEFIDAMGRQCPGEWTNYQHQFNHHIDEISGIGLSILLHHLVSIQESDQYLFSLVSAITQLEYFREPYQPSSSPSRKYWSIVSENDPYFTSSVFVSKGFNKILCNAPNKLLINIQRSWIIKSYMSLHPQPCYPFRYVPMIPYNPSQLHQIFQVGLEKGFGYASLHDAFPDLKQSEYNHIFQDILPLVNSDVYSYSCIVSENELSNNRYLRAVYLSLNSGPVNPEWNESLIQSTTNYLSNYGIPLDSNGNSNWPLLKAMLSFCHKSNEMITNFIDLIKSPRNGFSNSIPNGYSYGPNLLSNYPCQVLNLKEHSNPLSITNDIATQTYHDMEIMRRIREVLINPRFSWKPQSYLPSQWDFQCDKSLLSGICQFGWKNRELLCKINFFDFGSTTPDHSMSCSLQQFSNWVTGEQLVKRVSFLIMAFSNINRTIKFFSEDISLIQFHPISRTSRKSENSKISEHESFSLLHNHTPFLSSLSEVHNADQMTVINSKKSQSHSKLKQIQSKTNITNESSNLSKNPPLIISLPCQDAIDSNSINITQLNQINPTSETPKKRKGRPKLSNMTSSFGIQVIKEKKPPLPRGRPRKYPINDNSTNDHSNQIHSHNRESNYLTFPTPIIKPIFHDSQSNQESFEPNSATFETENDIPTHQTKHKRRRKKSNDSDNDTDFKLPNYKKKAKKTVLIQ